MISWKTDGSASCQQFNINATTDNVDGFTHEIDIVAKGGSPVNLMAVPDDPSSFPDSYWFQISIVHLERSSNISVGLVLPTEFQPGYKNKGMFYNGNLTNGSAALKTSYGPYLKAGDYVAIECAHVPSSASSSTTTGGWTVTMTIHVNGKRIGRGFEIGTTDKKQRFVPCVAVYGTAKFRSAVTNESLQLANDVPAMHPLEGKWKLVNAKKDTTTAVEIVPVPDAQIAAEPRDIIVTISHEKSTDSQHQNQSLNLSVHVYNNIGMKKAYTASPDQKFFELVNIGHGPMSTMMMPPPPYHRVEQELSKAMVDHWQSFRLEDDDEKLVISTVNNHVMGSCVRHTNNSENGETAALTAYHH
jgi:hypothetical protein